MKVDVWWRYCVYRNELVDYYEEFGSDTVYTHTGEYKTKRVCEFGITPSKSYNISKYFKDLSIRDEKKTIVHITHIKPCKGEPFYEPHIIGVEFKFDYYSGKDKMNSYKKEGEEFAKAVIKRYLEQYNKKHKIKFTENLAPYKEVNGRKKYNKELAFKYNRRCIKNEIS